MVESSTRQKSHLTIILDTIIIDGAALVNSFPHTEFKDVRRVRNVWCPSYNTIILYQVQENRHCSLSENIAEYICVEQIYLFSCLYIYDTTYR